MKNCSWYSAHTKYLIHKQKSQQYMKHEIREGKKNSEQVEKIGMKRCN